MESKEVIERLKEFANHFATNGYPYNQYSSSSLQIKSELNIIEKDLDEFSEYKRLEKELGIDLITLFKALKNGIWVKIDYENKAFSIKLKEICYVNIWSCLDIKHKRFFQEEFECYFKDYGKTWALTKEELE